MTGDKLSLRRKPLWPDTSKEAVPYFRWDNRAQRGEQDAGVTDTLQSTGVVLLACRAQTMKPKQNPSLRCNKCRDSEGTCADMCASDIVQCPAPLSVRNAITYYIAWVA